MLIELIRAKDNETVIVELEDRSRLYLNIEVVMKQGLRKGDNLSEDLVQFLIRENQKYFLRKKALDLLGRRAHSVHELKLKLIQRKYEQELINDLLFQLVKKNILDDKQFALQYAVERVTLRKIGKQKLKSELIKKGISGDIINEVLQTIDISEDIENALHLARKKMNALLNRGYDEKRALPKLSAYLLSKGYSFDIIKKVIRNVIGGNESDEFFFE